jgi:hypothetical protein
MAINLGDSEHERHGAKVRAFIEKDATSHSAPR